MQTHLSGHEKEEHLWVFRNLRPASSIYKGMEQSPHSLWNLDPGDLTMNQDTSR